MTSNNTTYERGRAVFLAAIMVLSVVAMSAAFAGAAAAEVTSADRTIEDTELAPGESTTVTVEVELDGGEDPAVIDEFSPGFAEVETTNFDPFPELNAVTDANDGLTVVWNGEYDEVFVEYEVTVPEDAENGDVFTFSGDADDVDNEVAIAGDDTITVTEVGQDGLSFEVDGQGDAVTIEEGETADYTATALFTDDSTVDATDDVSVAAIAGDDDAVDIDEGSNTVTATQEGTVTLEADDGEFTDTVEVTVVPEPDQVGLEFEVDGAADQASIGYGETVDYTAMATFEDGSTVDVTNDVDVSTLAGDGDVSINTATAEITGEAPGTVTLEATDGEFTDTVDVTVEPEPDQVDLTFWIDGAAGQVSIDDGETVDYTAVATFEDGSTVDVTNDVGVTLLAGDGDVSINTVTAEITGEAPGTVTLEATDGEFTDTVDVTVERSVATYTDEGGDVDMDGLRDAVEDWRAGNIDLDLLRDVVDDWRSS